MCFPTLATSWGVEATRADIRMRLRISDTRGNGSMSSRMGRVNKTTIRGHTKVSTGRDRSTGEANSYGRMDLNIQAISQKAASTAKALI